MRLNVIRLSHLLSVLLCIWILSISHIAFSQDMLRDAWQSNIPKEATVLKEEAKTLLQQNKYDAAIQKLLKSLELKMDYYLASYNLALAYALKGSNLQAPSETDRQRAWHEFERAKQIAEAQGMRDPILYNTMSWLAMMDALFSPPQAFSQRAERYKAAERYLEDSLKIKITGSALNNLGVLYELKGDQERSFSYYANSAALLDTRGQENYERLQLIAQQTSAPPSSQTPAGAQNLPAYFTATNDPQQPAWPDPTGGASGVWATPAGDGKGDVPEQLKPTDLYDRIAHNLYAINYVWALVAGFLVMFMQAGFMFVETGLCRAKNASHTSAMNLMIYPLGALGFWVYGFAIGWGNWWNGPVPPGWYPSLGPGLSVLSDGWGLGAAVDAAGKATGAFTYGLIGLKGWFLNSAVGDTGVMVLFFFMMVFMDTTATIPTGAMAERWAWKNFCLYGLWVALPYCLYANWLWGGGWLAQGGVNWALGHGAVDFAGSGVVHGMGGLIGLAGAMVIGSRIGKYDSHGRAQAMPGHNVPMVVLGTFILAFGWFGFNPGSTLAGTDLRISFIVVNTMLAGCIGSVSAMVTLMLKGLKPDTTMCCQGMLAGLVAITAPCAFVSPIGAAIIGAVAGFLVVMSVFFFERRGIDDPVGAISVHGTNGLWGVLSVGIFATGEYGAGWNGVVREEFVKQYGTDGVRGLLYGDFSQFVMQAIDVAVLVVFGFVMAYVWFKISNLITPLRVSRATEIEGLDGPEIGVLGYPDFQLTPSASGQRTS